MDGAGVRTIVSGLWSRMLEHAALRILTASVVSARMASVLQTARKTTSTFLIGILALAVIMTVNAAQNCAQSKPKYACLK